MPEFSNIEFEKIVLALLLRPEVRKTLRLSPSLLFKDMFSDDAAARMFDVLRGLKKTTVRPSRRVVISRATFSLPPTQAEGVEAFVKRIYRREQKLDESDVEAFPFYCEDLQSHHGARLMAEGIQQSSEQMLKGNYAGASETLLATAKDISRSNAVSVFRGDVVEDVERHLRIIDDKIEHPEDYAGMLTGIPLFDSATGGLFPREMVIVLAASKVGKSVFMLEVGHNAAWQGNGVLHITIEMDRDKAETRFYSRRSGIPHRLFRDPLGGNAKGRRFGAAMKKHLRESMERFHARGGFYHVVAFKGRSCTIPRIEAEIQKTEEKYGRRVDLLVVDYLNDLMPVESFQTPKNWEALGSISWDLSQLAKDFLHFDDALDQPSGLAIVTANQAKTQSGGKAVLKQGDFAYSPLPFQHANAVCFITKTEEDEENGTLSFGWSLARDWDSADYGKLFPNFEIMRIHDPELEAAFRGDQELETSEF